MSNAINITCQFDNKTYYENVVFIQIYVYL